MHRMVIPKLSPLRSLQVVFGVTGKATFCCALKKEGDRDGSDPLGMTLGLRIGIT